MTWPLFKMSDSLRAKELAVRAKHIVTTYGHPGATPFGSDMEWSEDGVTIHYDKGNNWRLVVFLKTRDAPFMRIYEEGKQRIGDTFCTMTLGDLNLTLDVLRKRMVLDDLAGI